MLKRCAPVGMITLKFTRLVLKKSSLLLQRCNYNTPTALPPKYQKKIIVEKYTKGVERGLMPKVKPSTQLISMVSKGGGSMQETMEHLELAKSKGMKMDRPLYNALVMAWGRSGRPDQLAPLLEHMQADQVLPDASTYNSIIHMYFHNDKPQQAEYIRFLMRSHGHPPNVLTYNLFIAYHSKRGDLFAANSEYLSMKAERIAPDLITFNNLLLGCKKIGDANAAEKYFADTTAFNLKPDGQLYNLIMNIFGKLGNEEKMNHYYQKMQDEKHPIGEYGYFALLELYAKKGEMSRVEEIIEIMNKKDIKFSKLIMASLLIQGYGKQGNVQMVEKSFDDLLKSGEKPNVIVFSALIKALGKLQINRAEHYFEEMKKIGVQPNEVTYNILAHSYASNKMMLKAELLLTEMTSRGIQINNFLLGTYIHAYAAIGSIDSAERMYEEFMKKPGTRLKEPYILANLFFHFGRTGNTEKVLYYLEEIKKQGFKPTAQMYHSLMSSYLVNKNYTDAQKTFMSMQAAKIPPNRITHTLLLKMYCALEDTQMAEAEYNIIKNYGLPVSDKLYSVLIQLFKKMHNQEKLAYYRHKRGLIHQRETPP